MGESCAAHVVLYPSNRQPREEEACSSPTAQCLWFSFVPGIKMERQRLNLCSWVLGVECYRTPLLTEIRFITACHFAEGEECNEPFEKHMFSTWRGLWLVAHKCFSELLLGLGAKILFYFVRFFFLDFAFVVFIAFEMFWSPFFAFLSHIWSWCRCSVERAWLESLGAHSNHRILSRWKPATRLQTLFPHPTERLG